MRHIINSEMIAVTLIILKFQMKFFFALIDVGRAYVCCWDERACIMFHVFLGGGGGKPQSLTRENRSTL